MLNHCLALFISLSIALSLFAKEENPLEDLFLSTPEQVATLTAEPSYLIGGIISPLSGQLVLKQTDLVIKGAQPIVLSRTYLSPEMPCVFEKKKHYQDQYDQKNLYFHLQNHYKGWQFYPHIRLEYNFHSRIARLSEPSGMTLDFQIIGSKAILASSSLAMNNLASDEPSGKYDPRNTRITFEGNKILVHATDGTIRIYRFGGQNGLTTYLYLIEKEILSNGKILKYHFDNNNLLHLIESRDPQDRHTYASLQITGAPWKGNCHFTSSSGLSVDYNYSKRPMQWKIKHKKQHAKETVQTVAPPILTSVSSPFYRQETLEYCSRFLLGFYSGKQEIFKVFNTGVGHLIQSYRVHQLLLPVGQSDAFIPVHDLSYNPPIAGRREGSTTVKNSDGTSILYHFSKNFLNTLIQYFDASGHLKKEKAFSWNEKNWLRSLEWRDGQKNLLYSKFYDYDRFGNPTVETLVGDLTGSGQIESFMTRRTFSEDGKHLLLKEDTEDGKVIRFSYLPNTDLIVSKLTQENDRIVLREFWTYDDCNNLIKTICDDGSTENKEDLSAVTQKTFKRYQLRQSAPFLHFPEWIEEGYVEFGIEIDLKKSHLLYDQHGNIAQEEVYDADGTHAYTIHKTYNERGDVLSETNALGQQAFYAFDAKGRLETKTNFSNRLQKSFRHDTKGRLRELQERGDDGIIHTTNGEVVVVDEAGNAIKVPEGNWLTGTKDGKWIQEMKPGKGPKGEPTGQRKDGGGHPPPKHTDIRANQPHAHVPGITNPDGTEWLPLRK